jgi:hypothetical protein
MSPGRGFLSIILVSAGTSLMTAKSHFTSKVRVDHYEFWTIEQQQHLVMGHFFIHIFLSDIYMTAYLNYGNLRVLHINSDSQVSGLLFFDSHSTFCQNIPSSLV